MFGVRFATKEDLPNLKILLDAVTKKQTNNVKHWVNIDNNMKYYEDMLNNSYSLAYGIHKLVVCYKEDTLYGVNWIYLRNFIPSWHFAGLILHPKHSYFNVNTNGVKEILTFCITHAESQGLYQYDFVHRIGIKYKNQYIKVREEVDICKRYEYYDVEILPANQRWKNRTVSSLYGDQIRPVDFILRTGLLKQEYRPKF